MEIAEQSLDTMSYPIELFQCGHGIPIAPPPPPSPPSPRTGHTSHGGGMKKQKDEVELASSSASTTKLRVSSRKTAGGAVVVVRVDGGGGGGGARRERGGSGTTTLAGGEEEESTLKMAQRKGRRGGVVLETLWPFAAVAEGLAEVEWEGGGGGDGEMEAECDSFMFARGGCPREGCRGGVEEDWERVGVYDEDDLRDLVSLREWVWAMEREAVAAIQRVREDATRAEEERTQEAGRKGKDDMRGRPLSRQFKIFSTLREKFCRLCISVRDGKRNSTLVGIRQRPPGIGKKEGQESRQVMAQKQLSQFSSHSSADYVTGHRVLSQLSMARMCLEQAEMLAVMQAPKGWFEACLQHVLEELERM
ncbi:hypothetical protein SLS58_008625 [Diplodia intermedia]|uniref:Uncharacterized protein n=1 Tax=Diplodia intermedia TaxID=856260 RepID=A0ABR3TGU7_9PEZI